MSGDPVREAAQAAYDAWYRSTCADDWSGLNSAMERLSAALSTPPAAVQGEATPQAAPADAPTVMPPDLFEAWFAHEVPPGTIISDPLWWAPRIYRQIVRRPLAQAAPVVQEPVAFMVRRDYEGGGYTEWLFKTRQGAVEWSVDKAPCSIIPLYAHPPVTTDGGGE